MPDTSLPHLPDDRAVWALSDAHGMVDDVLADLPQAVPWRDVIFGHARQRDGPTLHQGGHSLGIETGAPEPAAGGRQRARTLVGLQGWDLATVRMVSVPTAVDAAGT